MYHEVDSISLCITLDSVLPRTRKLIDFPVLVDVLVVFVFVVCSNNHIFTKSTLLHILSIVIILTILTCLALLELKLRSDRFKLLHIFSVLLLLIRK